MARATIKTIAAEAGVSIATVSKALNDMPDVSDAVKIRIREIANKQGYTLHSAAKELASGHSFSVGVILPDITQRNAALLLKSLSSRLHRTGYSVYLSISEGDAQKEATMAREMLEKRVGAIAVMPSTSDIRHIVTAVKSQIPVVYFGGVVNPNAENAVTCDDYKGGMMAARALYHNGSRNNVVFTWGAAATAQYERTRGFIAYMQEHDATVSVYHTSLPNEESGKELARQALAKGAVSGIFATDDLLAIGALGLLQQKGTVIPNQIQLVGYGNSPCASLQQIQLTTIAPPANEMGICISDLVIALARGEQDVVRKLTLVPQLIQRGTTISSPAYLL